MSTGGAGLRIEQTGPLALNSYSIKARSAIPELPTSTGATTLTIGIFIAGTTGPSPVEACTTIVACTPCAILAELRVGRARAITESSSIHTMSPCATVPAGTTSTITAGLSICLVTPLQAVPTRYFPLPQVYVAPALQVVQD